MPIKVSEGEVEHPIVARARKEAEKSRLLAEKAKKEFFDSLWLFLISVTYLIVMLIAYKELSH
jgi:hypothetical protein